MKPSLSERIANSAFRYWKAKGMTEWPTVRQIAKRMRIQQHQIEEESGELFQTTSYNSVDRVPFGEYFVEAMTKAVDAAWCEYYFPVNHKCYCGAHQVVREPATFTYSLLPIAHPSPRINRGQH